MSEHGAGDVSLKRLSFDSRRSVVDIARKVPATDLRVLASRKKRYLMEDSRFAATRMFLAATIGGVEVDVVLRLKRKKNSDVERSTIVSAA